MNKILKVPQTAGLFILWIGSIVRPDGRGIVADWQHYGSIIARVLYWYSLETLWGLSEHTWLQCNTQAILWQYPEHATTIPLQSVYLSWKESIFPNKGIALFHKTISVQLYFLKASYCNFNVALTIFLRIVLQRNGLRSVSFWNYNYKEIVLYCSTRIWLQKGRYSGW